MIINYIRIVLVTFLTIAGTTNPVCAQKSKKYLPLKLSPVSVKLEIYHKDEKKVENLVSVLTFDGDQKTLLSAEVINQTPLVCKAEGQFEKIILEKKSYLQAFIDLECSENNQTTKAKIGRLILPADHFLNYSKTIYLNPEKPQALLRIKELSL